MHTAPNESSASDRFSTETIGLDAPPPGIGSRRGRWLASLTKDEAKALRHIGLRVRAARLRRRMSRAELAVAAGLNTAHCGTIERGENNTTLLSLMRIAAALGVSASELLHPIK